MTLKAAFPSVVVVAGMGNRGVLGVGNKSGKFRRENKPRLRCDLILNKQKSLYCLLIFVPSDFISILTTRFAFCT